MMRDKRSDKPKSQGYSDALRSKIRPSKESGQIFRAIFDNAADGILLADVQNKKFRMGNQVMCQMLGCSREEIENLGVRDIHPEQDLPFVIEQFEKQARGELTLAKDIPVKRKDGSVFYADVNSFPIVLAGRTLLMGIFRDITEGKKSEEELKKFKTIAERAGYGVAISDLAGNLTYANKPFAQMHGYELHELTGKNVSILHNEEQIKNANKLTKKLIEKGSFVAEEVWHRRKDGTTFCALMNGTLIRDEKEQPRFLAYTAHDITKHKKTEQKVRESEEKYRQLVSTTTDAIMLFDAETRQFVEINKACEELYGYSREEFLNLKHSDITAEPEESNWSIERTLEGKLHRIPVRFHKKKGGKAFPVEISAGSFELAGRRILCGVVRDITERKKAEEALSESEARYRTLVERLPAVTYIAALDETSTTLYISPQVRDFMGFTPEEYKADPDIWRRQLHPDDRGRVLRKLIQSRDRSELFAEEYRMIAKDGSIVWFRDEAVIVKDQRNRPLFLQGVMHNITEHKEAEQALRESEERYRSVVENSPGLLCSFLPDGEITFVNAPYCEYFGKTSEELLGSKFTFLIPEEDRETVLNNILSLTVDSPSMTHEHKVIAADGRTRWHRWTNRALFDEEGRVLLFQSFGEDITDLKEAEQALHESEEKYRTLVETAPDPIVTVDKNGVFLFVNNTTAKDLECQPEDLVGKTLWDISTKNDADQQAASIRKVIETGQGTNLVALTEIKGQPRWHNVSIEPLKDTGGNAVAAMVIARDIHDIKQAEEQIRKLSSAVEQSIDGIAIADMEPRILYANGAYARTHGYTPEDIVGTKVEELHNQEQMDVFRKAYHQVITQGSWAGEIGHVRKDGTVFPTQMSVTLLKESNGEASGILAVCRDITEYRKTQEILRIKDAAIESSINGVAIADMKGNLTYVNNSFLEMWEYKDRNEVLGRNATEFWQTPDEASKVIETVQAKGGWLGELTAVKKHGSAFDAQVFVTMVTDKDGRPICMMSSFVDITESKQKEEELSIYREKMARAEQLASLGTLSATIAHELTQPLTVIRLSLEGALEKLQAKSPPASVAKKLEDSLNQVSNITALTERFRSFARKSSERYVKEVDLKTIAERILRLFGESARRAKVALRLEDMDELPAVLWDERDLEQVFFALVDNAIRAADGEEARQLTISGSVKGEHIQLRFSDNCGGIPPGNLDKVFEPFFTTRPAGQGTGLGLCIVKDIISRARGKIRLESQFGEGSTFFIKLPISEDRTC